MSPPSTVRVRVPATSANLGPGFDCAGLALALYDEVQVSVPVPVEVPGDVQGVVRADGTDVEVLGEGAGEVPLDGSHLVVRCARVAAEALGASLPGLRLRARNAIPHGRGLGSSAAAVVAGLLAGRALVPGGSTRMSDEELLEIAAGIEGHPDNVAPCLLGGFTLSWTDGTTRSLRLDPHPDLRAVVLVPPGRLATETARRLLPGQVPHVDAAANAARAALLVPALTRDVRLLLAATEDRLHQEYRAPAMPDSLGLVHRLRAAGVAATVSGAGPSVLVLGGADAGAGSGAAWEQWVPPGWRRLDLGVAVGGADIVLG